MKNFNYSLVDITDGFWKQKQDLNLNTTINAVYDRFYDTGRIDAFKMEWKEGMDKKPHFFWDSDVAKWIEGVAYILKKRDAPELKAKADAIIDNIENIRIYVRGHNLYDIFYGRYKNNESEILNKYIEAAPREVFGDILDKVDGFVYFNSRKTQ